MSGSQPPFFATDATNPVEQSGNVTPGHPVVWTTEGVVQDAGTPSAGLITGLGVVKASGTAIGITTGPQTGPYTLFGLGFSATDGNAQLSVTSFNGAPEVGMEVNINGVISPLPGGGGSGTPGGASGNIQYNNSGSFGGLTDVQVTARIQPFTPSLSGAVPASGGGTTNFLRADGTWAAGTSTPPAGSNGNIQYNNAGVFGGLTDVQLTTHVQLFTSSLSGAVKASGGGTTNFLRADGNWAPGTSTPPAGVNGNIQYNNAGVLGGLTDAQLTTHIQPFSTSLSGAVPASGGGTTNFLRADGTFAAPATGSNLGMVIVTSNSFGNLVGDGVTNNDTAMAALVSGAPAGSTFWFPPGRYLFNSPIASAKQFTYLGAGALESTLVTSSTTNNLLVLTAATYINNLGFDSTVTRTGGSYILFNSGSARSRVWDFWMVDGFNGFNITQVDIGVSHGEILNWNTGGAAFIVNTTEQFLLDNVYCQQGAAPGNGFGIQVVNGGVQMTACQFVACGVPMQLKPGSGQAVVSMWVVNSAFDSSGVGLSIAPTGSGLVARCWFIGCWFSSMTNDGVAMTAPSSGQVDGIDFNGCHVFLNGVNGINIQNVNPVNINICNCQIAGNSSNGVTYFAGGQFFRIINNRIGPCGGIPANGGAGINLGSTCDFYEITHNNLQGNGAGALVGAGVQSGSNPGVTAVINNNISYVSQNKFGGTITTGNSSAVVAHGLSGTPRLIDIILSPLSGTGTGGPAVFALSPTSTTITIEMGDGNPVGANVVVGCNVSLPCTGT